MLSSKIEYLFNKYYTVDTMATSTQSPNEELVNCAQCDDDATYAEPSEDGDTKDEDTEEYSESSNDDDADDADDDSITMPEVKVNIAISEVMQLESNYRCAVRQNKRAARELKSLQDELHDSHAAIDDLSDERDNLLTTVSVLTEDCNAIREDRDSIIADRDQIHEDYLESERVCTEAYSENEMCQARLTSERNNASIFNITPRETLQIPTDRKRAREATAVHNHLEGIRKELVKEQRKVIDEGYAHWDRVQADLCVRFITYNTQLDSACKRFNA
jgi:chromosome segregation ATPase